MSHRLCLSILLLSLFGGVSHSQPAPAAIAVVSESWFGDKWIADADDNICGIKDLKKVSNPAKVDYDGLWDATPQIKQMKDKKIDPESTEGKALRSQAKTLITKTCELVRSAKGHCGIWKAIKNEDGRKVPDLTDDVKDKLDDKLGE
jgi:hypothetical protein